MPIYEYECDLHHVTTEMFKVSECKSIILCKVCGNGANCVTLHTPTGDPTEVHHSNWKR